MPRVLGGSRGDGRFLMGEAPLYSMQHLALLFLPRKGQVSAFVGNIQNLEDLRGYLAHTKTPTPLGPT